MRRGIVFCFNVSARQRSCFLVIWAGVMQRSRNKENANDDANEGGKYECEAKSISI